MQEKVFLVWPAWLLPQCCVFLGLFLLFLSEILSTFLSLARDVSCYSALRTQPLANLGQGTHHRAAQPGRNKQTNKQTN